MITVLASSIPLLYMCLVSLGLYTGSNNLTGSILDSVPTGSPLQRLRLQNNLLTSSLPPSLSRATYLVDINVTHNRLSGTIPSDIGSIVPLRSFQAAQNNLSGGQSLGFPLP